MPNIKPISDLRNYTEVLKKLRKVRLYSLRKMVGVNM